MAKGIDKLRVIVELKKNLLDIEFKELLQKAESKSSQIQKLKGRAGLKRYQTYLDGIRYQINYYCELNKIDFDRSVGVVYDSKENGGVTPFFIAYRLLHYDVFDVVLFLNHQLKKRTSQAKKKEFVNAVKYQIKEIISSVDVFDNTEILKSLINWVVSKEESFEKAPSPKLTDLRFEINRDNVISNQLIKKVSYKLKEKGLTHTKLQFFNVFTQSKKIIWKGTVEHLVYIIHKLFENKYIITNQGNNKKWAATINYFEFYDTKDRKIENNSLAKILNTISTRSSKKYSPLRSEVDRLMLSAKNEAQLILDYNKDLKSKLR